MTSATRSQPAGRAKLLLPSPAAETSSTRELPAWLAPGSEGVKLFAMVKSCWLLWVMVNVGVGVGVAVGWTNAPEQVPLYEAPLSVTVQGAPFSSEAFEVKAGDVAA